MASKVRGRRMAKGFVARGGKEGGVVISETGPEEGVAC